MVVLLLVAAFVMLIVILAVCAGLQGKVWEWPHNLKQIFETVLAQSSTSFREVVLVEYPRKGLWAVAQDSLDVQRHGPGWTALEPRFPTQLLPKNPLSYGHGDDA